MSIRSAHEGDLPEILDLDRKAFPDDPYPYFVLRQYFDGYSDRILVLDDGKHLHGYVLFVTTSDGSVCWVLSLAISTERRGRGLGRRLMLEVMRQSRQERVHEVRLTVEPANTAAIMLYESLGLSAEDGVRRDYFGPGEDRLLMSLKL
ncbi:GNAT family N-acetyltransferase [Streptomyces sp. NPDC057623]|uniref:GNAT family N-acetyltransferase n=1 Tax=Streptomyces sp. NPDC057623 TaxID=3346187 RepID=UPI003689EFAE